MRYIVAIIMVLGITLGAYAVAWVIETVDSDGYVGWYTSLALDSSDNPHISYYSSYDEWHGTLKYAAWNGASWELQTVDSAGLVGHSNSLALDSSGNPHISYWDSSNRDLKYAHWNGAGWELNTVDSAGYVGRYSSLALDSSGNPHISYYDATNLGLKYAAWNGASWEIETVDSDGDVGWNTSLALDSSDNPHISYCDITNYDLKFATTRPDWDIEDVELTASSAADGVLLGWTVSGDSPASVRVLRGVDEPVAVSGSLDGTTSRWLDRYVEPGGSYVYWLETTGSDGRTERYGPTEAVVVPGEFQRLALNEPYPNPANSNVNFAFTLPEAQSVSLSIYDLAGRNVESFSIASEAGRQTISLNTSAYRSGVYLATLATDTASETRRFVISR